MTERLAGKKTSELCNNCGKYGHVYKTCKVPITSFGVIVFRVHGDQREYLMIRRKDTLGYIDFMRGKYGVNDYNYVLNMVKQMTVKERQGLLDHSFDTLWNTLWHSTSPDAEAESMTESVAGSKQFKSEEFGAKYKFNCLKNNGTLAQLIADSSGETWDEPEWGFPKGRRNYQEKDYECALREMTEETGYDVTTMKNIKNVLPYEEIFLGSNYKSYKHKYYLMYMEYADSVSPCTFDTSEVSAMAWMTYEECVRVIRPYNVDKVRILSHIASMLDKWAMSGP
jgi:8-oxo-dGTP pyrophosphatase MutT (NUDIX family)